jgi:hypothetical protein
MTAAAALSGKYEQSISLTRAQERREKKEGTSCIVTTTKQLLFMKKVQSL